MDSTIVVVAAVSAVRIGLIAREESRTGPGDAILMPPGAWHMMHDSTAACHAVVSRLAVALREGWLTKAGPPPYAHEDTYFE